MSSAIRRIATLLALGATLAAVSATGAQARTSEPVAKLPAECFCADLSVQ
jgi:hypothetical protein